MTTDDRKEGRSKTSAEAMTVTTLEPALTKKLLLLGQPKQRITSEAVLMANELLRLFIVEARQRAAIEVRRYVFVILSSPEKVLLITHISRNRQNVKMRQISTTMTRETLQPKSNMA
jgi:hypothetical protein